VIKNPESALNKKSPPGQTAAGFIYGSWIAWFAAGSVFIDATWESRAAVSGHPALRGVRAPVWKQNWKQNWTQTSGCRLVQALAKVEVPQMVTAAELYPEQRAHNPTAR